MLKTFTHRPRILHGAFVEHSLEGPGSPLCVVFQFNPVEISRSRSLSFEAPNQVCLCPDESEETEGKRKKQQEKQRQSLREYHELEKDLHKIREDQTVTVQEETISFDIRLDATDKLAQGDPIAALLGIAPQLSSLERMVLPKSPGPELGDAGGFSPTKQPNPPMVLFIWGRRKALPVNIDSLSVKETEFSPTLDPIRAVVSVQLTVIEGRNRFYSYSNEMSEAMSAVNVLYAVDVANVVIPI